MFFKTSQGINIQAGPVAQLDRASDYGSEGWGFDSSQVHTNPVKSVFWRGFLLIGYRKSS